MNLSALTESVIQAASSAGSYLKSMTGKLNDGMIMSKGQMDFVTDVDKESERRLLIDLNKILPEAGFIAEEGTRTHKGKQYNWIVDPLDGTTNFIHGVSPFCISIALMDSDELVAGIVFDPVQEECFSSWLGGSAKLNGKEIHVSRCNQLDQALVATGFPYTDFSLLEPYMDSLKDLMACTHGIRRLGSAAMDLAYVACGRYDAFWEYHLKPWDVAAGTVIIRQAGGLASDFYGGSDFLFGETYVATNGTIQAEFLNVLAKHFRQNLGDRQ
ncbi:MAG: inositol monophosphatase family protein [Bacteroidota bacterium]